MAPIRTTHHHDPRPFFDTAVRVASHYGFQPLDTLVASSTAKRRRLKPQQPLAQYRRTLDALSAEFLSAIKTSAENRLVDEETPPALVHFSNAARRSSTSNTPYYFGIGVIGSKKSIAEALLLRTGLSILEDLGVDEPRVHVNSLGDRDSLAKLSKELTNYFRKNINLLPPQGQQALKKDALTALDYVRERQHELLDNAPRPMEFLTEDSRRHLREIIEYLEQLGTHYEIDESLLGHRDCHSQTLFEVHASNPGGDEDEVVAWGGRFDELPRRLFRTEMPSAAILFSCRPKRARLDDAFKYQPRRPQVYFVQLSFEAKLRSLPLLDALRKARISVGQYLDSDRLSEQLERAEELGVPYTVIMGHKEAIEGTVLVRDMETRAQEAVSVEDLPTFLRMHLSAKRNAS